MGIGGGVNSGDLDLVRPIVHDTIIDKKPTNLVLLPTSVSIL